MSNISARTPRPTRRQEDCLEALFELSARGAVRLTDVSARLGVSKPTASACLLRLEKAGLVAHGRYSGFALTAKGLRLARSVSRTHGLLARFLGEVLGVPPAAAGEEACALEHAFTPRTLARLRAFMDSRRKG